MGVQTEQLSLCRLHIAMVDLGKMQDICRSGLAERDTGRYDNLIPNTRQTMDDCKPFRLFDHFLKTLYVFCVDRPQTPVHGQFSGNRSLGRKCKDRRTRPFLRGVGRRLIHSL